MRKMLVKLILIVWGTFLFSLSFADNNLESVISPDGTWIAFTKRSDFTVPRTCSDFFSKGDHGYEIWIFNTKTKEEKVLVKNHFSCDELKALIINPSSLQFSPDGNILYFEVSAWERSHAIHAVNIHTLHEWYVADGNEFSVLQTGKKKGYLVVNQHRYRIKKDKSLESYDWDWLYTPEGKEIEAYEQQIN